MNIFKRLFGKKEKPVDKDELRRKKQREYYQKNRNQRNITTNTDKKYLNALNNIEETT